MTGLTEQDVKNIIVQMFDTAELLVEVQTEEDFSFDHNINYKKKFVITHQNNGYKKVLVSRYL